MQNLKFLQEFNSNTLYLKNFAMKLTRDKSSAEDLFQETALSAFRHQKKYISDTNFRAWVSTIMKNSFINQYRKNKRKNEIQDYTPDKYFINMASRKNINEGEMNINFQEIFQKINSLDEGYRIPFLMAYQGYQYDEIQAKMNLPMGTIKSRIHHARKILKNQIKNMND